MSNDNRNTIQEIGRDLAKRSSQVAQLVADRSSQATQLVTDRSGDVLQELVERSEKASQDLARHGERVSKQLTKRGSKVSREVSKRSQKAAKEVQKRSLKAQRELAKRTRELTRQDNRQNRVFWPIFSFGLIAAAIATYLLVRRQLQQGEGDSQPEHTALNASLNGTGKSATGGTTYATNQESLGAQPVDAPTQESTAPAQTLTAPVTEEMTADAPIVTEPELKSDNDAPTEKLPSMMIQASIEAFPATEEEQVEQPSNTDTSEETSEMAPVKPATLLGVVTTKRYYPIETPLTELTPNTGEALDVVYFVTVDEAHAQGYSPAE